MKQQKMLVTVAIAAIAAMGLIGASSASADATHIVFCKNAELICENPLPNPTTIIGHAVNPKLLSSLGTVECDKSLIEVTVLNTLSTLIFGHILSLTLEGNCHLGGTSCTITTTELGGLSITKSGPLSARAKLVPLSLETGSMLTKKTIKCGSFINCTYTDAGEPELEVSSTAGGETSLIGNKTKLTGQGFLCPSTTELDVTYTLLGQVYIES